MRANVFRFAPESGLKSDNTACPKSARCRHLARGQTGMISACVTSGECDSVYSERTAYSPWASGKFLIMRRREFITLVGGSVAAWPLTVRAQQPAMPVIGFLSLGSREADTHRMNALRRGLAEIGYVEGQNVAIEYRGAQYQYDRLPALAVDLVSRQVAVIVVVSTQGTLAAKAATSTIPIVFSAGADPVQLGLVSSLNRPGGNITGVYVLNTAVMGKRLELLHESVPAARVIGYLANPKSGVIESETKELHEAARALGVELRILNAANESEIVHGLRGLGKRTIRAPCGQQRQFVHGPTRSTGHVRGPSCHARDLSVPLFRCCGRPDELRIRPC